ncbi:DNA cytosine methyltransferase [Flavobacterium adhaerens]|uniref:DNA cytosine methyltransferase n=1 Tax=Flavobacterium adhaerens TaxID=3149043 RepID=UPI0032B616E2
MNKNNSKKKIIGLSLFANVGIAEALFSDIDVEIKVANEIDKKRANFYSEVYPETNMICGDITNHNIKDEIINASRDENVNFIIATPPCQGMSEAGKRNEFDDRNQLITDTIDVIKKVNPDYILIENVPTLLKTKIIVDGKTLLIPEYIKNELNHFYNFNESTLIKAMDHGVPQMRQRNIFLMVKKEKQIIWEFPKKEPPINLRDALSSVPSVDPYLREGIEFTKSKFPNFEFKKEIATSISKWHSPPTHSWKHVEWMMYTPSGKSAIYNDIYFPKKDNNDRIKAHHNNYRRMNWDKPSRTITQNNGVISSLCCVHPGHPYKNKYGEILYSDPRVLTIYELLIVSTLPLNWPIPEWADETFIRKVIGEGIPSLLVKKIILELLRKLN